MTATLSARSDLQHWDKERRPQLHRPQTQPGLEYQQRTRTSKHSPNRIKARPANPAVISSILDSFDTLTVPSITSTEDDSYSDAQSYSTRPQSSDGTVGSSPSLARSISSGVVVENTLSEYPVEDEDSINDAALPPTVRTSRDPSGLSSYSALRTPSFTSSSGKGFGRTSSIGSRASSLSSATKERGSSSKNKLSAESWVMRNSISRDSMETDHSRNSLRSLRRKNSQDTLRPPKTRLELVPPATEPIQISRAEQIIAKVSTPPPSTSKRRLYLTDSGSNTEQSVSGSSARIDEETVEPDESPLTPAQGSSEELRSSVRSTSQANPMLDSIPMRTSSLRQSQSSSPASGRRRDRKSSRRQASSNRKPSDTKVDSVMDMTIKAVPESSWADLGEEDGTVRRIRELQERRRSRLQEFKAFYPQPESPVPEPKRTQSPVNLSPEIVHKSEPIRPAYITRPSLSRSSTDPPTKAHKVLGITADDRPASQMSAHPVNGFEPVFTSPESGRQHNLSVSDNKLLTRPTSSKSNSSLIRPLSLDYSYAEAVDALHGIVREIKREKQQDVYEPSLRSSVQIQRPEVVPEDSPVTCSPVTYAPPVRQLSTRTQPRKLEKRWSNHPDLPLDFDRKKNRRKSTSDTRQVRNLEGDIEPTMARRSSVEIAVDNYLQSGRLNRKIKHPHTGRAIAFSEVGDPNGAALFICLGMGLTRYVSAFYDELATTLRLRLITVDRPGVGASEPYPPTDRSGPLSWPDDVLLVCQHLNITQFSMLAHSAGAIYALATALILPHLIKGKVHLLAPWIPPSQLEAISHSKASAPPAGALPRSQRFLRVIPTPFLKAANSSFMTATSASLKPAKRRSTGGRPEIRQQDAPASRGRDRPASSQGTATDFQRRESLMLMDQYMPDLNPMENFPIPVAEEEENRLQGQRSSLIMSATATPMDPSFEYAATALNAAEHTEKERKVEYTTRLTARTWELAVRDSNPATDLLVCLERHRDVGFRYTDVNREVVITHGSEDKRVPAANVKWLAEQMNRRANIGTQYNAADDGPAQNTEGWDADIQQNGGCEVRILEGEGHGLMASPHIMGDILTEIAGYWSQTKTRSNV